MDFSLHYGKIEVLDRFRQLSHFLIVLSKVVYTRDTGKILWGLFPGKDSQSVMAFGLPQFQMDGYLLIFEKDVRKSKNFFADTIWKRRITNQYDNISAWTLGPSLA